jgi:hypothetical protein
MDMQSCTQIPTIIYDYITVTFSLCLSEFVSSKLLEDTYEVCNDGISGEYKKGFGGYDID